MAVPNNNPYLKCQQLIELEQKRIEEVVPLPPNYNVYGAALEKILVLEEVEDENEIQIRQAMEAMDTPPSSDAEAVRPTDDEDEEQDKVPTEIRILARMTLSDNNIPPKPFSGTSNDAEKADQWLVSVVHDAQLTYLEAYCFLLAATRSSSRY